jgi:GxxExxY protein
MIKLNSPQSRKGRREENFSLAVERPAREKYFSPLGDRNKVDINTLSSKIIGAAIEVHKALGPGLLESAYEECLCYELSLQGLSIERQKPLPVKYKGKKLNCCYKLDTVVENAIILELKSCEKIEPIHKAQLLTYLKLSGLKLGLLLNFNVPVMRDGIVRVVNELKE